MELATVAILVGLPVLLWSAGKFVDGAAGVARHFNVAPLIIGMVIIGFGTSAPEIIVSVFAAMQGNSGIALGNAFGSNIANIALVLGLTAVLSPIAVRSEIIRRELPIMLAIMFIAAWMLLDFTLSKDDAFTLLGLFIVLMGWSVWQGAKGNTDALAEEYKEQMDSADQSVKMNTVWLLVGLVLLIASSRILVWGAVEFAQYFGVSDTIIGLTVIAIGTSLPELASSLMAVRKNEHDLALGNVIGSNMFNTLAVVGLAGMINPTPIEQSFFYRDILLMLGLSVALFVFCIGIKGQGRLNRLEGGTFLVVYGVYTWYLINSAFVG